MLDLPENRAFARALIAESCRPGRDRILLFTQLFVSRGVPPELPDEGPRDGPVARFNQLVERFNRAGQALVTDPTTGWLLMLCGVALMLVLIATAFPGASSHGALDGSWTRATTTASSELLQVGGQALSQGFLALLLREEIFDRLSEALPTARPRDLGPREIGHKVQAEFGVAAGERATHVVRECLALADPDSPAERTPPISRAQLHRLHAEAASLFTLVSDPTTRRKVPHGDPDD
jgi:hypothetical protein